MFYASGDDTSSITEGYLNRRCRAAAGTGSVMHYAFDNCATVLLNRMHMWM
jgi:hypothetical protein